MLHATNPIIKHKTGLFNLAEELSHVSQACRIMDVSRDMNWQIIYYNQKVEHEILNLPEGLLARYLHLTDLMSEFEANLGLPYTKSFNNGLSKLRIKSKEGIARVFLH